MGTVSKTTNFFAGIRIIYRVPAFRPGAFINQQIIPSRRPFNPTVVTKFTFNSNFNRIIRDTRYINGIVRIGTVFFGKSYFLVIREKA